MGELSSRYHHETIATHVQLPAFAIDEMLEELAYAQRHQLQQATSMAALHEPMRRWLTCETPGSDAGAS